MTFDDETLMAYADGELDPIQAKRVERAIETDTTLADRVAAHRLLRSKVDAAYPIDTRPDPLSNMIRAHTVVAMPIKKRAAPGWFKITAVAAGVVALAAVGTQWQTNRVQRDDGVQLASRSLAAALQTQLASDAGDTRMLVSFRNSDGDYCRVFAGKPLGGIACKNAGRWKLIQTYSNARRPEQTYRQAGSPNGEMMKKTQSMMVNDPLSRADEQRARAAGWNNGAKMHAN